MKLKQIFGGVLLGLLAGSAMAQTTVTPLARTVSQWSIAPGGSLRVYATSCESAGGYGSVVNERTIDWSRPLYQLVLSNPTSAILTFSCIIHQY
jgi:hypothetical protein